MFAKSFSCRYMYITIELRVTKLCKQLSLYSVTPQQLTDITNYGQYFTVEWLCTWAITETLSNLRWARFKKWTWVIPPTAVPGRVVRTALQSWQHTYKKEHSLYGNWKRLRTNAQKTQPRCAYFQTVLTNESGTLHDRKTMLRKIGCTLAYQWVRVWLRVTSAGWLDGWLYKTLWTQNEISDAITYFSFY